MGLETTADAHGVLLLNSNAMGEEKDAETHSHKDIHMHICKYNHPCTHTITLTHMQWVFSVVCKGLANP